jgi:hypothetical protein
MRIETPYCLNGIGSRYGNTRSFVCWCCDMDGGSIGMPGKVLGGYYRFLLRGSGENGLGGDGDNTRKKPRI